jgi:hypothetical protein
MVIAVLSASQSKDGFSIAVFSMTQLRVHVVDLALNPEGVN